MKIALGPRINEKSVATALFVFILTMLGIFLRLLYLQKGNFILNDGGLFYTMILDLEKDNFLLPQFTSYNNSQIPYAYPPLSFYSGAILHKLLDIDLITIFRLYPLFFNILSIPAIFFLAMEITRNNRQAILATGFYAILLSGFEWLISGGGLTRSPAHTFFIISFTLFLAYLRTRRKTIFIFSIISASLMTLHHIEYCWMLVFSMVLFCFYHLSIKESIITLAIYMLGLASLTSPYWVVVLTNHGPSPFISAFTAGEFNFLTTFVRLTILVFTEETFIPFINVLAIIGMLFCLFKRRYDIVIWLVLIGFLNPRSANRALVFPVTILAAIALDELICPALDRLRASQNEGRVKSKSRFQNDAQIYSHLFILFSIGFPFFLGFLNTFGVHPVLSMLPSQELEAMAWISENTEKDSLYVILNPSIGWHHDKMGEWFPALTQRKSLTTIQGTEWLPDTAFEKDKQIYDNLKECADTGESCVSAWSRQYGKKFDYLVVSRINGSMQSLDTGLSYFNRTMEESGNYNRVYENEAVTVFKKK